VPLGLEDGGGYEADACRGCSQALQPLAGGEEDEVAFLDVELLLQSAAFSAVGEELHDRGLPLALLRT
jgi:hypothetical protein